MYRRAIRFLAFALVVLGVVLPSVSADAVCFDCYRRVIGGGEFFPTYVFEWCGPTQTGDNIDCYLVDDHCSEWTNCPDYIEV